MKGGFEVDVFPAHVEGEDVAVVGVVGTAGEAVPAGLAGVEVKGGGVVAAVEGAAGRCTLSVGTVEDCAGFFGEGAEGYAGADGFKIGLRHELPTNESKNLIVSTISSERLISFWADTLIL